MIVSAEQVGVRAALRQLRFLAHELHLLTHGRRARWLVLFLNRPPAC